MGPIVKLFGPTQAPERSRLGAGPGGFGIAGTPSRMKPSATGRPPRPWAIAICESASAANSATIDRVIDFRIPRLLDSGTNSPTCSSLGSSLGAVSASRLSAKLRVMQDGAVGEEDPIEGGRQGDRKSVV